LSRVEFGRFPLVRERSGAADCHPRSDNAHLQFRLMLTATRFYLVVLSRSRRW